MRVKPIDPSQLVAVGKNFDRPECVLATATGAICVSDWRGGVSILDAEGHCALFQAQGLDFAIKPNGIGLLADGSFLLAHLGPDRGGLFRLFRDGRCEPMLEELDGNPLPPTNYPHLDHKGRIWLTISTRCQPRSAAYRGDIADGFIVLIDKGRARIVAEGLGYTNECCVHPDGGHLYVNETFGRRLSRFTISDNGDLTNKATVTEFGHGIYPDGLTFDAEGGVWITSIVSNRIIRITPDGGQQTLLEDVDPDHLEQVEKKFLDGAMGRPELDSVAGKRLRNISSLAFGGMDLRTCYLGCLLGDAVMTFRSPIAGWPPAHWHHPL